MWVLGLFANKTIGDEIYENVPNHKKKGPLFRLFRIRFGILLDSFPWFLWSKHLHLFRKINRWLQNNFDNWKNYFSLENDFWKITGFQMYHWLLGMNICVLFDYFKVYTMLIALKNTVWFIVSTTSLPFLSKMSRWTAKSAGSVTGAEVILFVNIGCKKCQNLWFKRTFYDLEELLKRESFSKVMVESSHWELDDKYSKGTIGWFNEWYSISIFTWRHVILHLYISHTVGFTESVSPEMLRHPAWEDRDWTYVWYRQ